MPVLESNAENSEVRDISPCRITFLDEQILDKQQSISEEAELSATGQWDNLQTPNDASQKHTIWPCKIIKRIMRRQCGLAEEASNANNTNGNLSVKKFLTSCPTTCFSLQQCRSVDLERLSEYASERPNHFYKNECIHYDPQSGSDNGDSSTRKCQCGSSSSSSCTCSEFALNNCCLNPTDEAKTETNEGVPNREYGQSCGTMEVPNDVKRISQHKGTGPERQPNYVKNEHKFDTQVIQQNSTIQSTVTNSPVAFWLTPTANTYESHSRMACPTWNIANNFKYLLNYPMLFRYARQTMKSYAKLRLGKHVTLEDIHTGGDLFATSTFMQETLKKLLQKQNGDVSDSKEQLNLSKKTEVYTNEGLEGYRNQLWKRRYYCLLNAVEFAYEDHRLLHDVCFKGLFDFIRDLPTFLGGAYCLRDAYHDSSPRTLPFVSGTDPTRHLNERVNQELMVAANRTEIRSISNWPCFFVISVTFLSDVIAQSRILLADFDRRLAATSRLLSVLARAKEQRAKLRLYTYRQKETLSNLTVKLQLLRQQLCRNSPRLDSPTSTNDSLANKIVSPFVDPDCLDFEKLERMQSISTSMKMTPLSAVRINNSTSKSFGYDIYSQKSQLQNEIRILEKVLKEEETRRRRLHNRIQEATGNIRVLCRLRPQERNEVFSSTSSYRPYLRVSSDDKLLFCLETLKKLQCHPKIKIRSLGSSMRRHSSSYSNMAPTPKCFIFDRVFGPDATQGDIYDEVGDLIVSCIDGYNVCIMAYGQTGSGKTYTMMGSSDNPGVNRRAIKHLYERCRNRKHWKYTISLSIVEVYQEDVFDLLKTENCRSGRNSTSLDDVNSLGSRPSSSRGAACDLSQFRPGSRQIVPWSIQGSQVSNQRVSYNFGKNLRRRSSVKILSDQLDGVVLQNLSEFVVTCEEQLLHYLQLAERQRKVGSTRLNISSSRSHLVIILRVHGENSLHLTTTQGTLTLADLAGSENVRKSGSTGERFMEAACINKSLSSLGRVFDALRRGQKPTYRETKLTYLLRPCLSGDSKCLLCVTLRTETEHAEETWRALTFGQSVLQVIPSGPSDADQSSVFVNRTIRGENATVSTMNPARLLRSAQQNQVKQPHTGVCRASPTLLSRSMCTMRSLIAKRD